MAFASSFARVWPRPEPQSGQHFGRDCRRKPQRHGQRRGQLHTPVHVHTVGLDQGVPEQKVAAQLCSLAPMRVLYLTSSKKGKAHLSFDRYQLTSSTPFIVPTCRPV